MAASAAKSGVVKKRDPQFQRAFARIKARPWFNGDWICKTGFWFEPANPQGAVLKLLKPHWSNDDAERIGNTSGIFFSVWNDFMRPGRLQYNLHALKLRELKGYLLESRKFASAFRESFTSKREGWPNCRVDYGPQTLMQGFVDVSIDSLEENIVNLADRFPRVAEWIDALLLEAKKAQRP